MRFLPKAFAALAALLTHPVVRPHLHANGWPVLPYPEPFKRRSRHRRAFRLPLLRAWPSVGEYRCTFRAR